MQRIIILTVFLLFVEYYIDKQIILKDGKIHKVSSETKFNFYRSLMCLFFSLYSLENTMNNLLYGLIDPFNYKSRSFQDIAEWFIAYLIVDIGNMIRLKNTRWDLYVHHIYCLATYIMGFYSGQSGSGQFLYSFLLINESISIVSGVDSLYMELNEMEKSRQCKIYRKNIIKYLRIPIWLTLFVTTLYHGDELDSKFFWNGIISSMVMTSLDVYWEKKCDKVINSLHYT